MASEKTELRRHVDYLEARRSGAEWCIGLVQGEDNKTKIKDFAKGLSISIQENRAKLALIEQEELREKTERKAELQASAAARRKEREQM